MPNVIGNLVALVSTALSFGWVPVVEGLEHLWNRLRGVDPAHCVKVGGGVPEDWFVILVGYANSSYWHPFFLRRRLVRELRRRGVSALVITPRLPSWRSLGPQVDDLDVTLEALRGLHGQPGSVRFFGHSNGGRVGRRWLEERGASWNVRIAVWFAVPFKGTWLGWLLPTRARGDLTPGPRSYAPLSVREVVLVALWDLIVLPRGHARLPFAPARALPSCHSLALWWPPLVRDLVATLIDEA